MLLLLLHLNLLLLHLQLLLSVVVAGAVVGSGLIFAGSRPMVAVPGFVVVVVVALVALTLLPLGLPSSSHVHAWRVGVLTVEVDTLAAVRRTLLPTELSS